MTINKQSPKNFLKTYRIIGKVIAKRKLSEEEKAFIKRQQERYAAEAQTRRLKKM